MLYIANFSIIITSSKYNGFSKNFLYFKSEASFLNEISCNISIQFFEHSLIYFNMSHHHHRYSNSRDRSRDKYGYRGRSESSSDVFVLFIKSYEKKKKADRKSHHHSSKAH